MRKWSSGIFSWWLLLSAFLVLSCGLAMAQQTSTSSLAMSEPLWQALLQQTQSLPQAIQSSSQIWLSQIADLQEQNKQLQQTNGDLQASNLSLIQQLTDSRTSLQASQAEQATSEAALKQSQTDLQDSISSTTQAQKSAQALELQVNGWKYLAIGGAALGVAGIIYGLVK